MRLGWQVHHDQAERPVYTTDLTHNRCVRFWDAVRRHHMVANGWSDIAYSFGVCRCGVRFTGRGWNLSQWAGGADQVDDGYVVKDKDWYSVLVFIGGTEVPTAVQLDALGDLIQEARDTGRSGDRVIPHNFFRIKPCPGPELTQWCASVDGRAIGVEADDMTPAELALAFNGTLGGDGKVYVSTSTDGLVPLGTLLVWTYENIRREDLLVARIDAAITEESIAAGGGATADQVADKLAQRLGNG